MKVWFIKKKFTLKYKKNKIKFKGCKTNNEIQADKNIERVQDRQQDTNKQKKKMILKWNLIYDKL